VAEVRATDEAEDEEFGEARGDELPEQLRTPEGRREFFRQARQELAGAEPGEDPQPIKGAEAETPAEPRSTPEFEFDSSHITDAGGGRRRWLSEAKRQLEQHRWDNPDPISRSPSTGSCWHSSGWRPISLRSGRVTRPTRPTAGRG
jgi:hypothetical protein